MKILFHISSLYGGGAERVMSYLINHHIENGDDVTVVVCYEHENEYSILDGVTKIVIGRSNLLSQSKKLRKIIKEIRPDLCVSFMQGGNFRMVLANLFSRQKYVLSIRNDPKKEYNNFFSRVFAKIMFKKANGIVFQTPDAMSYFSKKIQKKSTVIFNPVSSNFFVEERSNNVSDIVSLGRLTKQKNFELLIDAYNIVKDKIKDNLCIYGDGVLMNSLQIRINNYHLENRIILKGRTNDSREILKNAKCFIMSSDFEGMPNALLEAVCMLVPSISTDCPCGGSKIILDGNGLLVPVNDANALGTAIVSLVNDEVLLKEISDNCKIKRDKFETTTILKEWNDFFIKVIS